MFRVRISSCGVVDVLMYEARQDIGMLQHEDIAMFGKLVTALCCHHPNAANHPQKALEQINRHYSADVKSLVVSLVSKMSVQGKKVYASSFLFLFFLANLAARKAY